MIEFINDIEADKVLAFIKTSQFGGVGGQPSRDAPSGTNIGKGMPSGIQGHGLNEFAVDLGFDEILNRTHRPLPISPNENLEYRLQDYHEDFESDMVPYVFTKPERQRFKIQKQIFLNNRPEKSKIDQKIKSKIIKDTLDEMISKFREKNDTYRSELKTKKNQKKPKKFFNLAKYHKDIVIASPIVNRSTNNIFMPHDTTEEREYAGGLDISKNRFTNPFLGITVYYTQEDGVDHYIKELTKQNYPDQHSGQQSIAFGYPTVEEVGYHNKPLDVTEIEPFKDIVLNDDIPTETKLQILKYPKSPKNLPRDVYRGMYFDQILFDDPEKNDRNTARFYQFPTEDFGTLSPSTSNLPNPMLK